MKRLLDPCGSLTPVWRQIIWCTATLIAIFAMFGMLALHGSVFVIVATSFFYWMPVNLGVGNLDQIGVSEALASRYPLRTQKLLIAYFFLVLACWIALDFAGQNAAHFAVTVGMQYVPNRWPSASLVFLGPIPPMILRIRHASWLAWQAKMQAVAEPA
jgi:hypothetical protein